MQSFCFGPECTISGYRSCKGSILLHLPIMMFGIVSEHFANLRLVKRCRTCVSGLNAIFRGTKVVKHSFYSIGPKMMFGSVSEHYANLRHVKICKTCVSGLNAYGTTCLTPSKWNERLGTPSSRIGAMVMRISKVNCLCVFTDTLLENRTQPRCPNM
jgi:hypothetical protein